jgi:tRNA (guanine-N7-)-methyltransferase
MNQTLHVLPRPAMAGELVPAHYFRTMASDELLRGERPLEIDLGCGDGGFLLAMARRHPERDFLGVERLLGRVRKVCRKINRAGIDNAQVLRLDSKYVIEWLLPPACVSRLHVMCPDPWPKLRHHRRRLIQEDFLHAVLRVLRDDGEFLFMTDHEEYHEWARDIIASTGLFENLPWQEDTFFHAKTDFQLQWEAEGKSMHRQRYRKMERKTSSCP